MTRQIWVILLLIVIVRILIFHLNNDKEDFSYPEGARLKISGVIPEPRVFENSQFVVLDDIKIFFPKYPKLNLGDYVTFAGLVKDGKVHNVEIIKVIPNTSFLSILRNKIIRFYSMNLPKDEAALIVGVVMGSRRGIDEGFWQSLVSTGVAHVVVASGANVILVGGFVLGLTNMVVKRKCANFLALGSVWLYATFCGMDAPIVRAGFMASLIFISQGLGHKAHTLRLLFLTALIMLLAKPSWLGDLGFILSFSATLSLIVFGEYVDSKLTFIPNPLREGLSTSLSAQILVNPILLISFGKLNLFSPIINALILWTIGPVTAVGMVAGIVSTISNQLAKFLLLLIYPLAKFFTSIVFLFNSL